MTSSWYIYQSASTVFRSSADFIYFSYTCNLFGYRDTPVRFIEVLSSVTKRLHLGNWNVLDTFHLSTWIAHTEKMSDNIFCIQLLLVSIIHRRCHDDSLITRKTFLVIKTPCNDFKRLLSSLGQLDKKFRKNWHGKTLIKY